jgi:hypothetical protein
MNSRLGAGDREVRAEADWDASAAKASRRDQKSRVVWYRVWLKRRACVGRVMVGRACVRRASAGSASDTPMMRERSATCDVIGRDDL